jgi:hypothetical protein
MSYCPKCGNEVDPTMTFCPNCGASLKTLTTSQSTPSTSQPQYEYRYRRHRREKEEKNEKSEKHEKPGGSYTGYLIGGLVLIALGVLAFVNSITNFFNGPIASAMFLVIIGVIIAVAGIYYASRARQRNPVPT